MWLVGMVICFYFLSDVSMVSAVEDNHERLEQNQESALKTMSGVFNWILE